MRGQKSVQNQTGRGVVNVAHILSIAACSAIFACRVQATLVELRRLCAEASRQRPPGKWIVKGVRSTGAVGYVLLQL